MASRMASRADCNSDALQSEFDAVTHDKLDATGRGSSKSEDESVDISEYDSSSGNSEMAGAVSADVSDVSDVSC